MNTDIKNIITDRNFYEPNISAEIVFEKMGRPFIQGTVYFLIKFMAKAFAKLDDHWLCDGKSNDFYIPSEDRKYFDYAIKSMRGYPPAKMFFEKYPEFWPELEYETGITEV